MFLCRSILALESLEIQAPAFYARLEVSRRLSIFLSDFVSKFGVILAGDTNDTPPVLEPGGAFGHSA
jgi:hypothetical protein